MVLVKEALKRDFGKLIHDLKEEGARDTAGCGQPKGAGLLEDEVRVLDPCSPLMVVVAEGCVTAPEEEERTKEDEDMSDSYRSSPPPRADCEYDHDSDHYCSTCYDDMCSDADRIGRARERQQSKRQARAALARQAKEERERKRMEKAKTKEQQEKAEYKKVESKEFFCAAGLRFPVARTSRPSTARSPCLRELMAASEEVGVDSKGNKGGMKGDKEFFGADFASGRWAPPHARSAGGLGFSARPE